MSRAVSVDWRSALIAVGLLLAGFATGYLSHREVVYTVSFQTVTRVETTTAMVTETVTRLLQPQVYLHEPPKDLEVRVDTTFLKLKVYVRNVGNETVWRVTVLLFAWSQLVGERVFTARIEEIEPGVTRVVEFDRPFFERPIHVVVVRYG